jgi:hypothetical protein
VIDQLRLLWNRPLDDGDRLRLFAIAVALIAGATALLTQLERPHATPRSERPPNPSPTTAPPAPAGQLGPRPAVAREQNEEGTRTPVLVSRADVAVSRRAARRFLAGYLPYTYGRTRARAIRSATPGLRRRLAMRRPRVPARERGRTPRLLLLQSDSVGHDHAEFVALVSDGRHRYTVALALIRARAGWRVDRAGS